MIGVWELLIAAATMVAVEVLLRTQDLPTTCRMLGVQYDPADSSPPSEVAARLPRRVRRRVLASTMVIAHWPAGDSCLRRCLLIGHRLRREGPALRIGVRRTESGAFSAHSWLEFDGRTLDPTASAFATLGLPKGG
ncbi:lasso peptide biosynthesis B2 protein [Pseudonocardia sp. GCM10023141]|uniref:lasso peptide biosynthesis B2 protein n=1 Tax=Pseudonocardia sp. GCM10023141 TaxID=3252653 RepID=UPI0036D30FA2